MDTERNIRKLVKEMSINISERDELKRKLKKIKREQRLLDLMKSRLKSKRFRR
tara:strand:- start:24 stop:182 length:159 start_codon:yes stop_codon:yes gene_type:complete